MIMFRYLMLVILYFFSIYSYSDQEQDKVFRSFWHPMYQGERLDYCTVDGKKCGKAVAHRYCQLLGYAYANQSVIAHNIGLTHYIFSNAGCKGWNCNGFMMIGCFGHLSHTPPKPYHYRKKRFVVPRYNHYRVDWCYNKGNGCGLPAANSFCSHMGFMRAQFFIEETQVGITQTIGSQELCVGNQCNAFKEIICYR